MDKESAQDIQSPSQDVEDNSAWEIVEIIDEKDSSYKVRWAGFDPDTNKPWPPSWVDKDACEASILVEEWTARKAAKKREMAAKKREVAAKKRSQKQARAKKNSREIEAHHPPKRRASRITAQAKRSAELDLSDITDLPESRLRPPKRQRIVSSQESSDHNADLPQRSASRQDDEIVAETPPEHTGTVQVDDTFLEDEFQYPPRSQVAADMVDIQDKPRPSISYLDNGNIKSRMKGKTPEVRHLSYLHHDSEVPPDTGISKPLRTLPLMSPSALRPCLSSEVQDPIEDFSSPVKPPAGRIHPLAVDELGKQSKDPSHLPATASTQLADVDSQSQVIYAPDSQESRVNDLKEEALIVKLLEKISDLEDDALLRDSQILDLQEELDRLKSAEGNILVKAQEQAATLAAAEKHVMELQTIISHLSHTNMLTMASERMQHNEAVHQKGRYELLVKKELRTDSDELRRRAAEHPELKGVIVKLTEENEALKQNIQYVNQCKEQVEQQQLEISHLRAELEELQNQQDVPILDSTEEGMSFSEGISTRLETVLQAHARHEKPDSLSQAFNLWVCRHTSNSDPCHGLFMSESDARAHAIRTHFPSLLSPEVNNHSSM